MNAACVECGKPADVSIQVTVDHDAMTLIVCRTCSLDALATIAATIDMLDTRPFDKAIARLEQKQRNGTASDNDVADLQRWRRLRADAVARHPSNRATNDAQ